MKSTAIITLALLAVAAMPAAAADGIFEYGLGVGLVQMDNLEVLGNTLTVNPRFGYFYNPTLGVELDVGVLPIGKTQVGTPDPANFFSLTPRLNLVGRLFEDKNVNLLLSAGAGVITKSINDEGKLFLPQWDEDKGKNRLDVDLMANAGPGVLMKVTNGVHFRADAKWLVNIGSENWQNHGDVFIDWEYTAGFMFAKFGPGDTDKDGIDDEIDQCVNEPEDIDEFEDEDGCPEADNDKDGINDPDDKCPLEAEDLDEFEDEDGCPEADNDQDGINDDVDACPLEKGTEATKGCPDQDEDGLIDNEDECPTEAGPEASFGCPDKDGDLVPDHRDDCPEEKANEGIDPHRSNGCASRVFVSDKKVVITEKVQFASGSSTIKSASNSLLDEIYTILAKYKGIKKIQIEGHTDSRGNDDSNKKLSQSRAEAVVAYLVKKGIAPERMVAKGFGEEKPVADNNTSAGRADNRRVEFNILEQDMGKRLKKKIKKGVKVGDIPKVEKEETKDDKEGDK